MVQFQDLRLNDASPTPQSFEDLEVHLNPEIMLDAYATAVVEEAEYLMPRMYDKVNLQPEEMIDYCRYLLNQRVLKVNNKKTDWQFTKQLWIPAFIQFALTQVGRVELKEIGITLVPVLDIEVISGARALEISQKLSYFKDKLVMAQDAMPRSNEGDTDTMSCAIIADYVCAQRVVAHPMSTYIAAFMGFKIREDSALKALYRVQYDHTDYIIHSLLQNRGVIIE